MHIDAAYLRQESKSFDAWARQALGGPIRPIKTVTYSFERDIDVAGGVADQEYFTTEGDRFLATQQPFPLVVNNPIPTTSCVQILAVAFEIDIGDAALAAVTDLKELGAAVGTGKLVLDIDNDNVMHIDTRDALGTYAAPTHGGNDGAGTPVIIPSSIAPRQWFPVGDPLIIRNSGMLTRATHQVRQASYSAIGGDFGSRWSMLCQVATRA